MTGKNSRVMAVRKTGKAIQIQGLCCCLKWLRSMARPISGSMTMSIRRTASRMAPTVASGSPRPCE
ncbi:hypothetical protein D3C81_1990250 [compost metagenome]